MAKTSVSYQCPNCSAPLPYQPGADKAVCEYCGTEFEIAAIEEAVMTMASGAKVTLITPSELAFGEFDLGETLPPYSPLKIELELVEIK